MLDNSRFLSSSFTYSLAFLCLSECFLSYGRAEEEEEEEGEEEEEEEEEEE